jgi:hypothetical protein
MEDAFSELGAVRGSQLLGAQEKRGGSSPLLRTAADVTDQGFGLPTCASPLGGELARLPTLSDTLTR